MYALLPDIVGEGIMFSGFSSSVLPDRSRYYDILWTAWAISMKLTRNNQ